MKSHAVALAALGGTIEPTFSWANKYLVRLRVHWSPARWRLPAIRCDESRQDPRLELLGQYLRDGHTQSDLAHELAVSQQRVSDVVSGKKPVPDAWLQQLE